MSYGWNYYSDKLLQRGFKKACIAGLKDGDVWCKSQNFLITQNEIQNIIAILKCNENIKQNEYRGPLKPNVEKQYANLTKTPKDFTTLLPNEINLLIFEYLRFADILRCTCISSSWKKLLDSPHLWSRLIHFYFRTLTVPSDTDPKLYLKTQLTTNNNGTLQYAYRNGVQIEQTTYMFINFSKGAHDKTGFLYARCGSKGVCAESTLLSVIIGVHEEFPSAGNCSVAMHSMASYLIENGY